MVNNSIIDWMLEENNPSIRYRTLIEILDKSLEDSEVQMTYKLIWQQKDSKRYKRYRDVVCAYI